jgi:hypothetical protein
LHKLTKYKMFILINCKTEFMNKFEFHQKRHNPMLLLLLKMFM